MGGLFSTLLQNSLAEYVLPQISRILTDGVCLEFCEFREFCGTSHAPSESVKICAICGRIILAAWVIAWLVPSALLVHLRQVHPLQGYEGRGVHAAQQVAVEQCAGGAELVDIAVGGVGAGIRCVHVGGAGRYVQRVGRLHGSNHGVGSSVAGKPLRGSERRQSDGVRGEGVLAREVREGRAETVEPALRSAAVRRREVEDAELLRCHVQHHSVRRRVVHVAGSIDAEPLAPLRHLAVQVLAARVDASQLAHGLRVDHRYGLLVAVVLRLCGVAARVGYVEPSVVVGDALRLVAHVAGVYHELRREVYLCHVAVVGVRRDVEVATVVGSHASVVGYVLRGSDGGAVGSDVLHYVRPVYGDGYQRVVHQQHVVRRVAESLARVLLSEPVVGEHAVVEQR